MKHVITEKKECPCFTCSCGLVFECEYCEERRENEEKAKKE